MAISFLFSHLKELLRLYVILFYRFFHILLTFTNILIERNEMSSIFNFCRYACHVTAWGHTIFLSIDNHYIIILNSKQYSVCPSKYQDHSKPLKHLPINIWSATDTFIWLIPVVTSTKLPLMRSKMYPRWRTSHYFK